MAATTGVGDDYTAANNNISSAAGDWTPFWDWACGTDKDFREGLQRQKQQQQKQQR